MIKRVLITGGSRGIGAAIVRKFASEGRKVAFVYKNSDAEAKRLAREEGVFAIKADLRKAEECERAVREAAALMGGVDVLINNAGISEISLFTDISNEALARMLDVNLSAPLVCARECAKMMIREKYGRIINIGSMWGITGASCEVHYSAAKAGLIGMTKALAKELGPSGITVNCICPGVIDTAMNSHLGEADIKALIDETPLCRIGSPSDVAELAFFLSSDSASFITGQVISVDGGFAV